MQSQYVVLQRSGIRQNAKDQLIQTDMQLCVLIFKIMVCPENVGFQKPPGEGQ
jgi:hypothetical protein